MSNVAPQQKLSQEAIWKEIVNILQPDKKLNVLQIIRQSNILQHQHKKIMNRVLYVIKSHQVIKEQDRGKPRWSLRQNWQSKSVPKHKYNTSYNGNKYNNRHRYKPPSNPPQSKEEQWVWTEILKIISPDKSLNVLEIIRRSNTLQHRDKKIMNRVLYRLKSSQVTRDQGHGKPKWRLRRTASKNVTTNKRYDEKCNTILKEEPQFRYKKYLKLSSDIDIDSKSSFDIDLKVSADTARSNSVITWYQCLTRTDVAFYSTYPAEWCWNIDKKWIKFQENHAMNPKKAEKADSNRFWFGDSIICDLLSMKVINNQSGYQFDLKRTDTLSGTLMQFGEIKFQRYYNVKKKEVFLYDRNDNNEDELSFGDIVTFKVRWNTDNTLFLYHSNNTVFNNKAYELHEDMIAFDIKRVTGIQKQKISDHKEILPNAEEVNDNPSINRKCLHISSVISSPFDGIDSVSCYIYHIKFDKDAYNNEIGIVLSKQIDDYDLRDIRFPIQMNLNEEVQWTEIIKQWVQKEIPLNESVAFDEKHIVNTEISLQSIKGVHKLSLTQFNMIKTCNKFMFEKVDERQQCKLIPFECETAQKRFYYICPLSDDLQIDNECLQRIYLASGALSNDERLNAKQFMDNIPTDCNLKHEIIEIINQKKEKGSIGISYGVERHKFDNIRKQRVDSQSVSSFDSFASKEMVENTNKLKGINQDKLLNKASKTDILLLREEDEIIENVLNPLKAKKISGFEMQHSLSYRLLTDCFPTGITTNLWYKLKMLPAILYRIETLLNVIDLRKRLYSLYQTDYIELNVLFDALHRSPSSNMSYEILNNMGSYVLKFISTLHSFRNHPMQDHKQLYNDARISLVQCAERFNIISYIILEEFDYKKWSPPQFFDRNDNSLYYVTDYNAKHMECALLQSIIGAVFVSSMKQHCDNPMSNAIINTSSLSKSINIIDDDNNQVILQENNVLCEASDCVYALKQRTIGDELKMNVLLQKALQTVIEKGEQYKTEGITFKRLEFLGDAVLDLLIIWLICYKFIDELYSNRSIFSVISKQKSSFNQYITQIRHRFVNSHSLGFKFIENCLDEHIMWFDDNTKNEIMQYKDEIRRWKDRKKQPTPSVGISEYSDDDEWPLSISAPATLADCYESILGAIFVGSHPDMFKKETWSRLLCSGYLRNVSYSYGVSPDIMRLCVLFYEDGCNWNLRACIDFLCSTLNLKNRSDWDNWTSNR